MISANDHMIVKGGAREIKVYGNTLLDLCIASIAPEVQLRQWQLFATTIKAHMNGLIHHLCHLEFPPLLALFHIDIMFISLLFVNFICC